MATSTLDSRTVVVTGAGSGIGAAIARALADAGARVVSADINFASAQSTADVIVTSGGDAIGVCVDITDRASVAAMLRETLERFTTLDVMVNNAGISGELAFADVTAAEWNRMMTVNGMGTMICMQEAAKVMIEQGRGGKIVNTTSITARRANATFAHYAASKAAVSSLIQSGARALAPHGITVTGFAPGIVETELWETMFQDETARQQKMESYASQILLGRVSTPDDVTAAAVFLAGPGSDYMTGQVIMVDGGIVLV